MIRTSPWEIVSWAEAWGFSSAGAGWGGGGPLEALTREAEPGELVREPRRRGRGPDHHDRGVNFENLPVRERERAFPRFQEGLFARGREGVFQPLGFRDRGQEPAFPVGDFDQEDVLVFEHPLDQLLKDDPVFRHHPEAGVVSQIARQAATALFHAGDHDRAGADLKIPGEQASADDDQNRDVNHQFEVEIKRPETCFFHLFPLAELPFFSFP